MSERIALQADTIERALAAFLFLAEHEEEDVGAVDLGDWAAVQIHLPESERDSSITPPFMEAFLQIQKQLFQLAALAKSGVADTKQLF